jgi:excisionase family DNA binding protein
VGKAEPSKLKVIPLSDFGLEDTETAAKRLGVDPSTVRRWVRRGELPTVPIGTGRSAKYLVRIADVDTFQPNPVGAPEGNQNAVKKKRGRKPGKKGTEK